MASASWSKRSRHSDASAIKTRPAPTAHLTHSEPPLSAARHRSVCFCRLLCHLEHTIVTGYHVMTATLIPGRLTEDVPVFAHGETSEELTIYGDVRNSEVTKLEKLGITALFTSMVAAFCREYLGETLRTRSPKFFESGAVNLDWLAKRRSELWVLLTDDIEVLTHGTQRQVVTSSDVQVVRAGPNPRRSERARGSSRSGAETCAYRGSQGVPTNPSPPRGSPFRCRVGIPRTRLENPCASSGQMSSRKPPEFQRERSSIYHPTTIHEHMAVWW